MRELDLKIKVDLTNSLGVPQVLKYFKYLEGSRRRAIEFISFTSVIPTLERSLRDTAS